MTIKVRNFGFHPNSGLSVDFNTDPSDDALKFLTALGAFVSAYSAGSVAMFEVGHGCARDVAPPTVQSAPPAPSVPAPVVETTVVPPRAEPAPKAAKGEKSGSAQPAEKASEAASSQAPAEPAPTREPVRRVAAAPKAATPASPAPSAPAPVAPSAAANDTPPAAPGAVDVSGVERVTLESVPDELKTAKSFRAALVYLKDQGHDTLETMVRALHKYGAVPVIARYLVPNPDPELAIEARVARALEAFRAEKAA